MAGYKNHSEEDPPLKGMRVLDLGRYQAGPRCALMFARMGAEVIKVEALDGDESRLNAPRVRGQSAYWVQYNSGKKSLAINLRTDEGREVLRDLVKISDIFLQNFRPGTIEKMGFSYDRLKAINPGIVMVNVSAYGQYGPYKDRVGFDQIGQALGGLMSMTGFPDDPPTRTYFSLIDRITSLHGTIGALAALLERERTGRGQAIDVSLADTGFTVNEIPIAAYLGDGQLQAREGNGAGVTNAYETSDGWAFVIALNDAMWERMCDAIEKPDWKRDERMRTRAGRVAHADILEPELVVWFRNQTTKEAVDRLSKFGVPVSPINDTASAAQDPHLHQREVMVEVPDQIAGKIYVAGKMIKFSRTPMVVGPPPLIGEHTDELLKGTLGYPSQKVIALKEAGIVRSPGEIPEGENPQT